VTGKSDQLAYDQCDFVVAESMGPSGTERILSRGKLSMVLPWYCKTTRLVLVPPDWRASTDEFGNLLLVTCCELLEIMRLVLVGADLVAHASVTNCRSDSTVTRADLLGGP